LLATPATIDVSPGMQRDINRICKPLKERLFCARSKYIDVPSCPQGTPPVRHRWTLPRARPSSSRLWRLKYRVGGKEKRLALGRYPDVSLRQGRADRYAARELIRQGRGPIAVRKAETGADAVEKAHAFKTVDRGWHEMKSATGVSGHAHRLM